MPGALFAFIAAASFGLQSAATRRGVLASSAIIGIYITVVGGVPLFLLATALSGQLFRASSLSWEAYLLLAVVGPVHYLVGRYSIYRATGAMGANRASPLNAMSSPYAVAVAVIVLGERVTPLMGVGMALVMAAPFIMVQRRGQGESGAADRAEQAGPPGPAASSSSAERTSGAASWPGARARERAAPPRLRLAEGYLFGTLSAIAYGTTPILVRAALRDTGLSMLGGLVAYSSASILLLLALALPGRRALVRGRMDTTAIRWFAFAGVTIFLAQMFWFLALGAAPVTVVSPIMRSATVYTLLFSFLVNRRLESFGPRVLGGMGFAISGAVLVALRA